MSSNSWNAAIAEDVIAALRDEPGPVLIALQAIQEKFGFVHEDALQMIADQFNVSRAEVFGVFTYYHDLKKVPHAKNAVKICAAEACQSVGCDSLIAEAEKAGLEVEKAYCFGNCALGPAAMVGNRLIGRATLEKLK
ncbi:MAG: NAD(P)H-dependent oxidoreductase subunit E [Candidatus Nanopelagicaceae bacterium]